MADYGISQIYFPAWLISFGVNGGTTGNFALPAPAALTLVWTSAANVNLPVFNATGDLAAGDTVRARRSLASDFSTGVTEDTNLIDAIEDAANALEFSFGGTWSDATWYVQFRNERPGHDVTDWSNTETKTIDATAPTLSSPSTSLVTETTATISVTTNEANGRLYYVLDQNTSTPSAAQVKAGLDQGGAAADKSGNSAILATGVKSFNLTGLTGSTTYKPYFMHEDDAGNQSTVSTTTAFTTDAGAAFATLANAQARVTLSNANLTATSTGADNSTNRAVSSVGHSTGKYYCEATLDASGGAYGVGVGVTNTTTPTTASVCAELYRGDPNIYVAGTPTAVTDTPTTGDRIDIAFDADNEKIWVRTKGGTLWNNDVIGNQNPATNTGGVSTAALGTGTMYVNVFVAAISAVQGVVTFNFGATSYVGTPPVGFGNW